MFRAPLFLLLALLLAGPASALTVSLAPGAGTSAAGGFVNDGVLPTFPIEDTLTVLPAAGTAGWLPGLIAGFEGSLDYVLDASGFVFELRTERLDEQDHAARATAEIYFTVDEDVGYSLSGLYALDDPSGHQALFTVSLTDLTAASTLFGGQVSHPAGVGVPDPSFDIATTPGFGGALSGTLLAGREYRLFVDALSQVFEGPAAAGIPGIGAGQVALVFVPEPRLAPLVLLALGAWLVRGRR